MKRILTGLIVFIFLSQCIYSQNITSQGNVTGEIFTDYHYIVGDSTKTSGFGLNRAYLGYHYTPAGNFSSLIMINIGTPEDLAQGSIPRRYAYFREASVTYTKDKLVISFGMVSTRIFDFQQKYWGKRYLGPEFQALYGYGTVADLGIVIDYKLNDLLKFDISILNGEGYTNVQVDNSIKTAAGIILTTPNKISVRLYGDILRKSGVWQSTMIAFAGMKSKIISFGGEFSYKKNIDLLDKTDIWGLSATGSVFLNPETDIFGRIDYTGALPETVINNDYNKYTTFFIGGIQHVFNENLKIALNYRRTNPYLSDKQSFDAIYLNAGFKF
jgi:hypothetical protein